MDDRRHRVNPGRTPQQRRRGKQSYDYLHGWSQGWQDARRGQTRPIPRQSGGGKPPRKRRTSKGGCALWLLAPHAALITGAYLSWRGLA